MTLHELYHSARGGNAYAEAVLGIEMGKLAKSEKHVIKPVRATWDDREDPLANEDKLRDIMGADSFTIKQLAEYLDVGISAIHQLTARHMKTGFLARRRTSQGMKNNPAYEYWVV